MHNNSGMNSLYPLNMYTVLLCFVSFRLNFNPSMDKQSAQL